MFSPGLDGNQVLDFYWTDPIDAMKRSVSKLQYKDKLYTTFKPGMSITEPMVRAFDEANSGMVFQSAYLLDKKKILVLMYSTINVRNGIQATPRGRRLNREGVGFDTSLILI